MTDTNQKQTNETAKCTECDGSGKRPGASEGSADKFAAMCPYCAGTGKKLKLSASILSQLPT